MEHYEIEYRRSNGDHTDVYGERDGDEAKRLAYGLAEGLIAGGGGLVTVYDVRPTRPGDQSCYVREVGRLERLADGSVVGSGEYADGATLMTTLDSIYDHMSDAHTEPCRCELWAVS